jgi:hypothetical protein
MWYFTIRQDDLKNEQHQRMRKIAHEIEIEIFNEPYHNLCIFELESDQYSEAMNYLDLEGITYEATTSRPKREDLLEKMRG